MNKALALLVLIILSGCASTPKSVPSEITLKEALQQVKDGIELLQKRSEHTKPAGLLISEAQVTFNITASSKDASKIGLDLAPANIIKEIPTGSFEKTSERSLSRSNQITFKFQNLFLANKDSLVGVAITPITTTTQTTTTKEKEKETTKVDKGEIRRDMSLAELYGFLNDNIVVNTTEAVDK